MTVKSKPQRVHSYAGHDVTFTRRRYGTQTFTWAHVRIDGESHEIEGDPWPCITPKRAEVERAVTEYVTLHRCRYFELRDRCLPLITDYQRDLLEHDRNAILEYGVFPYLHITRPMGTYYFDLAPADHPRWPKPGEVVPYLFGSANRWHILSQHEKCLESQQKESEAELRVVHHFDGKRLRKIDFAEAININRDHVARVTKEWRAQ